MIDCIVFDLDGTLADARHRLHLIRQDPPDWPAFFDAARHDPPFAPVLWLNQIVGRVIPVVIMTGRPASNRPLSTDWLHRHRASWHLMLMRADEDRRQDGIMKVEMVESLRFSYGLNPIMVIDDRPSVLRALRGAGIYCLAPDSAEWVVPQAHYDGAED
jgi:phosphoglycolate phosphatase-like HAD superfamily hydrolase